ncbi:retrotransposon protein, putative, ty1-copia subclass [Tanacetum coccineum]
MTTSVYQQLRIVLSDDDKLNYLEHPIPTAPVPSFARQQVPPEALAAHAAWVKGQKEVQNCPQYLFELLKNKKLSQGASTSGIFTIELFTFPRKSWVYDTGYGTHICNTTQGLKRSMKLKPGALSLYMGNGQRAAVEAIGSYHLCFPSRLVVVLHNCHYAPFITRGIISVSRLYNDGFIDRFDYDNTISVSRNNLVYFSSVLRDGIYEIDLSDSNTNDSFMYAVSNKRAKLNLDSSLLWHCRLGHISKKRIEKLQQVSLLNSIDTKSFEKCVSCLFRKMAQKPYSHQVERAKDLLRLIHIDVCSPFKIVSRQRASYFVTFTDEFSRYGYVYLLKHKHEVFETFKVFQKEIKNQLGKTIKSLCSDRRGEYISQEFLDHLKEHEIIAHHTPPYTPQHDGVFERRNRTLLDMVRSMMSQTTLLKSFWNYALEFAARILNMVPIKKVEKTPYEVWYGQSPKLSYLKVWGCEALVKRDTLTKPDKLEPRSIKCIFVGYPKETMGYSFYYPPENKVFVVRNAEFFKNSLITQEAKIDEPQSDIIPIRRSTRTRHAPDRMCLNIEADKYELRDLNEPANYKAALLDPKSDKWLNAMNVEMQSMKDNENLGELYWSDVRNIPKYLCNTKDVFLVYEGDIKRKIKVSCYIDVGYLTDADDLKSQTKYVFVLNGANESRITKGARHYRAKVHYLREVIEFGDVKIEKVHTNDNLADPFTKALAFPKHSEHRNASS